MRAVHYGDVFSCRLSPVVGSEEGKLRPVIIVQRDRGNRVSPTTIIVPLSTRWKNKDDWFHIHIEPDERNGLYQKGTIMCEQIRVVDMSRLHKYFGKVSETLMVIIKHEIGKLI